MPGPGAGPQVCLSLHCGAVTRCQVSPASSSSGTQNKTSWPWEELRSTRAQRASRLPTGAGAGPSSWAASSSRASPTPSPRRSASSSRSSCASLGSATVTQRGSPPSCWPCCMGQVRGRHAWGGRPWGFTQFHSGDEPHTGRKAWGWGPQGPWGEALQSRRSCKEAAGPRGPHGHGLQPRGRLYSCSVLEAYTDHPGETAGTAGRVGGFHWPWCFAQHGQVGPELQRLVPSALLVSGGGAGALGRDAAPGRVPAGTGETGPCTPLPPLTPAGPLCSVCVNRFGCRPVMLAGGLLASLGMVAASFCGSVIQLYLTTGVITGERVPATGGVAWACLLWVVKNGAACPGGAPGAQCGVLPPGRQPVLRSVSPGHVSW